MSNRRRRGGASALMGVAFTAPATALLVVFIVWPIVIAGEYSTLEASGYGDKRPIGAANYRELLGDEEFWSALVRNVVFAGAVAVMSVVLGFVLAYVLYIRVRGWRFLQVGLLVPYVVPVVVTAVMWKAMLEPENGVVNATLRSVGLDALAGPWLTGVSSALPTVSLVQTWVLVPFAMLLLFGAMLSLPPDMLEAAEIDGAGHLGRMVRIVLPSIRATVALVSFVIVITMFRSFDLVWLLTQGGPLSATTIGTLYVFMEGFRHNRYGYANAVGIVLGAMAALIALSPLLLTRLRRLRRAS